MPRLSISSAYTDHQKSVIVWRMLQLMRADGRALGMTALPCHAMYAAALERLTTISTVTDSTSASVARGLAASESVRTQFCGMLEAEGQSSMSSLIETMVSDYAGKAYGARATAFAVSWLLRSDQWVPTYVQRAAWTAGCMPGGGRLIPSAAMRLWEDLTPLVAVPVTEDDDVSQEIEGGVIRRALDGLASARCSAEDGVIEAAAEVPLSWELLLEGRAAAAIALLRFGWRLLPGGGNSAFRATASVLRLHQQAGEVRRYEHFVCYTSEWPPFIEFLARFVCVRCMTQDAVRFLVRQLPLVHKLAQAPRQSTLRLDSIVTALEESVHDGQNLSTWLDTVIGAEPCLAYAWS